MKAFALDHAHDLAEPEPEHDAREIRRKVYRKASAGSAGGQHVEPAEGGSGFSSAINAGLVSRAAEGTGHALPDGLRGSFESSLGTDLGGVRVHTGGAAAAAADALDARAYAVGQDVFMGAGQYDPGSADGAFLLAHEVAHTVQQQGASSGPQCKLEVSEPGDAVETDADTAAHAMVRGEAATVMRLPTTAGARKIMRTPRAPQTTQTAFSTRAARPIGIEGSPIQPRLDALVNVVEQELAAWRSYMHHPHGPRPGNRAYTACMQLTRDLATQMPGPHHGYDARIPRYLAHRIGMDQGFMLDDMTAFNTSIGSMACREVFGLTTATIPHPVHSYRLEVQAGHVYRFGVPVLSASLQFRNMVVLCESRIAGRLVMTYRQVLDTQQAGVQGGGAFSRTRENPNRPRREGEPDSPSGTHDGELTTSESEWTPNANFLPPEYFAGGFMSAQASATAQAGAVYHQGSVGASHQIITFAEIGAGQDRMSFELTSLSPPNVAAGHSTEIQPNFSVGAGLEVGPGHASLQGAATGTAGPERHATGGSHRTNDSTLLLRTQLFFDTQHAELDAAGQSELSSLASRVRAFLAEHPDCHFEFEVIANASPRWTGVSAQRAAILNGELSQRRANTIVDGLHARLAATDCSYRSSVRPAPGGGTQDEQGEPCDDLDPSVGAQGSEDALQHGVGQHEDPQEWRSVEINVYRNVYEQDYIQGHRQPSTH